MSGAKTINKVFVLYAVLLNNRLSKADCIVLAALIEYTSGIYGLAWPSKETLADVTGLDPKTVQRSLRKLEKLGIVQTDISAGRLSNRYRVSFGAFTKSPFAERISAAAQQGRRRPRWNASERTDFEPATGAIQSRTGASLSPNGGKTVPQTLLINPSENPAVNTARPDSPSAPMGSFFQARNFKSRACEIERKWKAKQITSPLAMTDLDELYRIADDTDDEALHHIERIRDSIRRSVLDQARRPHIEAAA